MTREHGHDHGKEHGHAAAQPAAPEPSAARPAEPAAAAVEPVAAAEPGPGSDHVGLPVAGYRSQPAAAVDQVNIHKVLEEQGLRELDRLAALPDVDQRWLALGRTHIEQGWMAVNRAVFKPDRAKLPNE